MTLSAGFVSPDLDADLDALAVLAQLRTNVVFELAIPGAEQRVALEVSRLEGVPGDGTDLLALVLRSPVAIHGRPSTSSPILYQLHVRGPLVPTQGGSIVDPAIRPRWTGYGSDGLSCSAEFAWSLDRIPVLLNGRSFGSVLESRDSAWSRGPSSGV